jgi:hypothetical protein
MTDVDPLEPVRDLPGRWDIAVSNSPSDLFLAGMHAVRVTQRFLHRNGGRRVHIAYITDEMLEDFPDTARLLRFIVAAHRHRFAPWEHPDTNPMPHITPFPRLARLARRITSRGSLAAIGLVILAVAACTACQPAVAPLPGRIDIAGDSLTIQAAMAGAIPNTWDATDKVGNGWQAEHAQARLTREVTRPWASPDVLIMAFGSNDASVATGWGDGYTPTDRAQVEQLLATPHPDTTRVVILPHRRGPSGSPQLYAIDQYRHHLTHLATTRGYCVADWEPAYAPHRNTWGSGDGTHLTPTGATAYGQFIQAATTRCTGA